jgi:uncharacterized membrane protein (DUF2068 family)
MRKRSVGLLVIIGYKTLTALVLLGVTIAMLVIAKQHLALENWVEEATLGGREGAISSLTEHVLQLKPRTLGFGAVVAGLYSSISAVEAIGLWHGKTWAQWLVLGAIGMGLFPELWELAHGVSPLKVLILTFNVAILIYLIRFPIKHHH